MKQTVNVEPDVIGLTRYAIQHIKSSDIAPKDFVIYMLEYGLTAHKTIEKINKNVEQLSKKNDFDMLNHDHVSKLLNEIYGGLPLKDIDLQISN